MKPLDNFIEKLVEEYQEHFKKGNSTLGTLPNDWEAELHSLVHGLCEKQKQVCAENATILVINKKTNEIFVSKSDYFVDDYSSYTITVNENSILNTKNVCYE